MSHKTLITQILPILGIGLILAACSSTGQIPETSGADEPKLVLDNPSPTDPFLDPEMSLPDHEATELMYDLALVPHPMKQLRPS